MIRVSGLCKSFGRGVVLDSVSLEVPDRTISVVLGALGSGKSVLLRIMAGLMPPDAGCVTFERVPEGRREGPARIGFVFQGGALFDSMTVWENVALPLAETQRLKRRELQERVEGVLERVGMADVAGLWPRQLSGGMIRLVAIARALITDPDYLFFDEPTVGLDPVMREQIVGLVRSLRDAENRTCVVVTHDLETAHTLADRLYMLKDAKLQLIERARKEDYESPCA